MLILHEIGEVIIGDITPADNVSPEEKFKSEHEAIEKIVGDLEIKDDIISLLYEFDEHKTKEAKFAYLCDKFDAIAQAKVYEDMGAFPRFLNRDGSISKKQKNNRAFKLPRIHKFISKGYKTVFDIWYENDKTKFQDDEVFSEMLKYLKSIDTKNFTEI